LTTDGLLVRIRRSKTDQEGAGRLVGVPYGSAAATCPVRALRGWFELRCDVDAALFRRSNRHGKQHGRLTDKAVARIVKRAAARMGIDPAIVAGHSLWVGLATSAAAADLPERVIAQQTGHKSMAVLRRYIWEGSLFQENAAARVGLQGAAELSGTPRSPRRGGTLMGGRPTRAAGPWPRSPPTRRRRRWTVRTLRRDEEANITRDDDEAVVGRCRVRAWFEPPRPDRPARHDVRVSDVEWERGTGPARDQRYALRFADRGAIVVLFDLPSLDDRVTLQGLFGPGGVRIR
jgi:hypothetical protein